MCWGIGSSTWLFSICVWAASRASTCCPACCGWRRGWRSSSSPPMPPSKPPSRRCGAGRSITCPSRSRRISCGWCSSGLPACASCSPTSRIWKNRCVPACRKPICKRRSRPCCRRSTSPSRRQPARRPSCCAARAAPARACWPGSFTPAARRSAGPFVTVHCPSLQTELLESELFGHVKGAFTGAVQDTVGKVAVAEEGTLFLDEIGDLPPALQPKLLRLLQEKQYERVGESRTRACDVRILAATNRDLQAAVAAGAFPGGSALSAQRDRGRAAAAARSGPATFCRSPIICCSSSPNRPASRSPASPRKRGPRCCATPGPATSASCATPSNAASFLPARALVGLAELPAQVGAHAAALRAGDRRRRHAGTTGSRTHPPRSGPHGHHGPGRHRAGHRPEHAVSQTQTLRVVIMPKAIVQPRLGLLVNGEEILKKLEEQDAGSGQVEKESA